MSQSTTDIRTHIARLRSHAPTLPLLFALRSSGHGGTYDGSNAEYVAICDVAVRDLAEIIAISDKEFAEIIAISDQRNRRDSSNQW